MLVGVSCRAADAVVLSVAACWQSEQAEVQLEQQKPVELVGQLPLHEVGHEWQHLEQIEN